MTGYLCNLPKADYKYTEEEKIELLDMYVNGEWEAYPDRYEKEGARKGAFYAFLLFGSLPAAVVCGVSWAINQPEMTLGGLIMAGIIHGILIIFGIAGIFTMLATLFKNDENNPADLAEREANAHAQVLKQMSEELTNASVQNKELLEENEKYKKAYLLFRKLNDEKANTVKELRNTVLNREITIIQLRNKNTRWKLQGNCTPDSNASLGDVKKG